MFNVLLTAFQHCDEGGGLLSLHDFGIAFIQLNIHLALHHVSQMFQLFVHLLQVCQQSFTVFSSLLRHDGFL
ncbi:MAG: hypothetical protein OXF50_19090 [Caldilineaceae bacterium]|nr:hypothetical protein [Caldilineaceae bacterium]